MRIINGTLKGRQIKIPDNVNVRPTTDRAKEGLFNTLNNLFNFDTLKVLDLFAGSGNIGLEFASRDAVNVILIEKNNKKCEFIQKTIENFALLNIEIKKNEAIDFLKKCKDSFDIIFADPPFDFSGSHVLIEAVFKNELLSNEGIFILEHSTKKEFETHPRFMMKKKYGHVCFSFFE